MSPPDLKAQIPDLVSGSELLSKQAEEPRGLATGFPELDEKLLWRGFPRQALSLLVAAPGLGATSFWLEIARRNGEQKRWSLWISPKTTLFAPALIRRGLCLKHLYAVRAPETPRDLQFVLRECLESRIFTLVGCEVENLRSLRRSLPKIKALVEKTQTAFLFLSRDPDDLQRTSDMSWVAELKAQQMIVHKAKNRPSFSLPWRGSYAHLLSQLSPTGAPLGGGGLPEVHSATSLSRTGPIVRGHQADLVALQKLQKLA